MISREEKNKEKIKKIQREQNILISKKILHVFVTAIVVLIVLFSYIYFLGVKGLQVFEYNINSFNIPKSFYGIKILHFTDLLYGNEINDKYLLKLQDEIKIINPDIVFFTGNLINSNYQVNEEDINKLNAFFNSIPYSIGKYCIKGNLDNSTFDLVMENTNFTILNNEINNIYNLSNDFIHIIGINDNNVEVINKTDNIYTITLINNYDNYSKYNIDSNLVLAGNNLGGEIRFFGIPLIQKNKYNNKFYEENDTKIYISSGIGSLHHMRFMNHPSVNVYRLISKEKSD